MPNKRKKDCGTCPDLKDCNHVFLTIELSSTLHAAHDGLGMAPDEVMRAVMAAVAEFVTETMGRNLGDVEGVVLTMERKSGEEAGDATLH